MKNINFKYIRSLKLLVTSVMIYLETKSFQRILLQSYWRFQDESEIGFEKSTDRCMFGSSPVQPLRKEVKVKTLSTERKNETCLYQRYQ